MDLDIGGRTGLVTGASAGIGRGIALALGREGVRLAVVARRRELLEALAEELSAAGAPNPTILTAPTCWSRTPPPWSRPRPRGRWARSRSW